MQKGEANTHLLESDYWRAPLDIDEYQVPVGTVNVIMDRCKGCNFCIEFCPNQVLEQSEEFNSKGYHPPEVVNQAKCMACDLCQLICPEFAIYVTK
jgi:2-oxoglutarate ferredoxin oxidoreductase subunit delta